MLCIAIIALQPISLNIRFVIMIHIVIKKIFNLSFITNLKKTYNSASIKVNTTARTHNPMMRVAEHLTEEVLLISSEV